MSAMRVSDVLNAVLDVLFPRRCPFCQNSSLVLRPSEEPEISEEEILKFLKRRKGILEGVCISGGEPTLSADLEDFISKIREMGYPVKLDTNGTQPEILKNLAEKDLIQMAAVDIKACPENYPSLTGLLKPDLAAVKETVDFLLHGKLDYEFRTTVVRELHNEEDLDEEAAEHAALRQEYIAGFRENMRQVLENTYVQRPDGTKTKLQKKAPTK